MPKELPDGAVYTPFITPYRKVTMLYICGDTGDKASVSLDEPYYTISDKCYWINPDKSFTLFERTTCAHRLPKEVSEANRANYDGFMTAMYNGWVERLTKLQNEKGSFSENEWETVFKKVVQDWHAAGKKW